MAAPTWIPGGMVGWPPTGLAGGLHSRLLGFVKTALLQQLVAPDSLVCDLFCGRGLDTERWAKAGIGRYIGVDFSASALEEAREQWEQHGRPFPAEFCELDPCMVDLEAHLHDHGLPADVVCCLAHFQDSFTSEDTVRCLLKNVEAVLKPGGFFFGTAPDSSTIWYKYQKAVEGAMKAGSLRMNGTLPSVRTDIYKISFDDDRFHAFGSKYHMRFTDDGLPAQPQLLVHFPSLIRLARDVGLECIEIQNLLEFFEDYSGPFADALRSCCGSLVDLKGVPVLDAKGRLNGQASDVLSLYTSFIFKKGDSTMSTFRVSPTSTFNGPSTLTNASDDQLQMVQNPHSTEIHDVANQAEDLLDGASHHGTWHDYKGTSELMQETCADQKRDDNAIVLDGSIQSQIHGSMRDDLDVTDSKQSSRSLQMRMVHDDGCGAAEHMIQLTVDESEFRSWPVKEASNSSERKFLYVDYRDDAHGLFARDRNSSVCTKHQPTSAIPSLRASEKVDEARPGDHVFKDYVMRTDQSLDKSSSDEKDPGRLVEQSPKHYMRRTHEGIHGSSMSEKQQDLSVADNIPKHDLRRTSESGDDSHRCEKQEESALVNHTSKHQPQRADEICKQQRQRADENLDLSNRRPKQQEAPPVDLNSKHNERRPHKGLDESTKRLRQQEQPLVAGHSFKCSPWRTDENLDPSNALDNRQEPPPTDIAPKDCKWIEQGAIDESNSSSKQQEAALIDLSSKRHSWRTGDSLDASTRRDTQQERPLADFTSKHYERRSHDMHDGSNRSSKQQEPPPLADFALRHHLRRSDESFDPQSRRDKHQELLLADNIFEDYEGKAHEPFDESNRNSKQEPPLAVTKHQPQRTGETLDSSNRCDKQQEPLSKDITSKHYERRTHETLDESNRSSQQQGLSLTGSASKRHLRRMEQGSDPGRHDRQLGPASGDTISKHYDRRAHSDFDGRSSKQVPPMVDHTAKRHQRRMHDSSI